MPTATTVPVTAISAMTNNNCDSPDAKRNRGWIKSNPDCGFLAFHPGNTPEALISARGAKNAEYAKNMPSFSTLSSIG